MDLSPKTLRELLRHNDYISEADAKLVDEALVVDKDLDVYDFLIFKGLITKDLFAQAIAEHYKIPYADLNSQPPSKEQILNTPEDLARNLRIVLVTHDKRNVTFATDQPENIPAAKKELSERLPGMQVNFAFGLSEDIDNLLNLYLQPLAERLSKMDWKEQKIAPEVFSELATDALAYKASDIHMEPQVGDVAVRFRIDGQLQEVARLSKEAYESILNYIKVQSKLRIDQHFVAQDGAMRFTAEHLSADLRVSIVPTLDGEKIVIRILSKYVSSLSFSELGLSEHDQQILQRAATKPFGMVLNTGPTGSGKTTTIYSLIHLLHRPQVNITTIEDPVEYKIPGINQIQVNPQSNLTFAKGLRAVVRQDPNVILVGEIRDQETADIAVNAALTGHMLLSTFHANDAATAIPRLLEMGIEPFLLASTLNVLVSQRLARRVCENCKVSYQESRKDLLDKYPAMKPYLDKEQYTFYKGNGCDRCHGSGYKGRLAVFELIEMTPEMQALILNRPATHEIWALATKQGSKSFFADGLEKILSGALTLEELVRVAPIS